MFSKLYPGDNFYSYVKRQFKPRICVTVLISVLLLYFCVLLVSTLINSLWQKVPFYQLYNSSGKSLAIIFLTNLISGPMGEEIGWRGYLLTELQKKYSVLKAAMIVGVIWSFWHTLLWFVSGFTGMYLLWYIISFVIIGISNSIITAMFYQLNRNLIIPILTHQLLNFFLAIQESDMISLIRANAIGYLFAAVGCIIINYKKSLYSKQG